MFIYNVSMKIDHNIAEKWKQWMMEIHFPKVMDTKCFERFQFAKLIDVDESEGATFVTQYYAESKADINRYSEIYAPALRKEISDVWGDKFIAFRTLMEVVQ